MRTGTKDNNRIMEQIQIIGNLAADARQVESKTPGGEPFMAFTAIVSERRGDSEVRNAYNVTYRVTRVLEHLKTGKTVYVQGRPSVEAFMGQDGTPRARIVIRASSIELV